MSELSSDILTTRQYTNPCLFMAVTVFLVRKDTMQIVYAQELDIDEPGGWDDETVLARVKTAADVLVPLANEDQLLI